jgi:F-type H+-transporting ATPase subunit a
MMNRLLRLTRNRLFQIFVGLFVIGLILQRAGIYVNKLDIEVRGEAIACIGGVREGKFCSSGTTFPITNALLTTAVADVLLALTIIFGARNMQLIPRGFQNIVEAAVEGFYNFALGVDRKNIAKFFPVCATIFFFVLYGNVFEIVPGVGSIGGCVQAHEVQTAHKEPEPNLVDNLPGTCSEGMQLVPVLRPPSSDLNMTLAVALLSFTMTEFFGLQALGLNYLTKFFNFREGVLGFIIGILELISEFVRIIAFAFRLFGNIFAGDVVLVVMSFLFPYLLPLPFYGFEVFVVFIQAAVFGILTLVFMSVAVQAHGGHDEHDHAEQPVPVEAADLPGHGGGH